MRDFNLMCAGFCAAAAMINFMTGQYVMAGVVLFFAVASYKIGGMGE